jgi:glycosyltransferase involved in cell wall biosynthesis
VLVSIILDDVIFALAGDGDGELREFLEKTIKDLSLVNKVYLKSTTKDIGVEYCRAQIFVLPSIYESFGLVVVEALAHGLPVVGFADCEGVNTLVDDNINGVLVKNSQGRVIDLSVALEKLMGDTQFRYKLSENCRSPEGYDINSVLNLWEETVRPENSN